MRQTAVMLSGSFFFLVAMLAFMLNNMTKARETKVTIEEALKHELALPLLVASVVTAALSFLVKRMLTPPAAPSDLLHARMREASGNPPDQQRLQRYFAAHIVAYALSETPAIFGFVVGSTTGCFEIAVPLFALSLALFAFHWPRVDSWK